LNDASQVECAKALALNLNSVTGNDNRIQLAFRRCFGRQPTAAESSLLNEFLSREMTATSENEALIALCRVILNSEEFLTRE
jgi:hypothetical protein